MTGAGFSGTSGNTSLERGRALLASDPKAAADQARAILRTRPRDTAALRLLARAAQALGDPRTAAQVRASAVRFSRDVPAIRRAHQANVDGRPDLVEGLLREHLSAFPDDPVALLVNGEAYTRLGRTTDAVRCLRQALDFMPEYREAGLALIRAQRARFDIPGALEAIEPLVQSRPRDPVLLRWKASLLSNLGENAASAEILQGLLATKPDVADVWLNLGDELRTLGKREESRAAYRRAAELRPNAGRPWWGLAALGHQPFDAQDRAKMAAALADAVELEDRYHLHFALATAFDQAGVHREAFEHFTAGNALRRERQPPDPEDLAAEVPRTRSIMTPEFFAERAGSGCPAPDPIFIVSMPRSGSTLVEQVLASHRDIEGAGELPFIPLLIRTMAAEHRLPPGRSYRELLPRVDPAAFAAIGEEYMRLARAHRRTNKPYFLDKLPHNWGDLGFLKLILPNARVIDVRRSPLDCCWSNFRMLFATGHPASNSLDDMVDYYRHYVAMMDHFDTALPGHVHRVIYERLVEHFEAEVRRMLDYLGLPFDPACLEFHANRRSVATASADQVRRPLNREGVGAWRTYEPWLGPLVQAVGDLEQTYAGTQGPAAS